MKHLSKSCPYRTELLSNNDSSYNGQISTECNQEEEEFQFESLLLWTFWKHTRNIQTNLYVCILLPNVNNWWFGKHSLLISMHRFRLVDGKCDRSGR